MLTRVVVGCLAIGFVGLQSCTAVLGMERATLDLNSDAAAGGSGNVPNTSRPKTNRCKALPTDACSACLQDKCGGDYDSCIGDRACRVTLDKYAFCLGDNCQRVSLEDCANENLDPGMAACVATCQGECSGTTLVDPCALYCGCTPTCTTGAYAQVHPDKPALTGDPCLETCRSDNRPTHYECLRRHCDFAAAASVPDDQQLHCEHATGIDPVCEDAVPTPPTAQCLDRSENGWPCNAGSECCSGNCGSNVCF